MNDQFQPMIDEIEALEPCATCDGCIRRVHVLNIIAKYAPIAGERPMRAKILEWAQNERNDTQRESGILLAAIIEAMDAQTASQEESIRLYRLDLYNRGVKL